MKLKELLQGLETTFIKGPVDLEIKNIHYDSRKIAQHGLFVATTGLTFDGHDFIDAAKSQGAVAVVVEKEVVAQGMTVIGVKNSKRALSYLSRKFFRDPSKDLGVMGITGTNGKTTTTYLLESIYKCAGFVPGVLGTINYRCGKKVWKATHTTPESYDLQRIFYDLKKEGATHVMMEVSSHALAQDRVEGIHFDAGIFSNLTRDHLDFHKNFENYFDAKRSLFTKYLPESQKKKKTSIINIDDEYGRKLAQELKGKDLVTYGFKQKGGDFSAQDIKITLAGIDMKMVTPQGEFKVKSPLVGYQNVSNILAAYACAGSLGIKDEYILKGVEKLYSVPGRLEPISIGKGPSIFVDYAHTDDALKNVLQALNALKKKGKIWTVFGCGGDRDKTKRPLMGKVAESLSDVVIVTSDNPRTESADSILEDIKKGMTHIKPTYFEVDRTQAIFFAIEKAREDDVILIAGKGHETYQILGKKVIDFDDRQKALKALKKYWDK